MMAFKKNSPGCNAGGACGCGAAIDCHWAYDNFDREDNDDIDVDSPVGWTEHSGTWEIIYGKLYGISGIAICDTATSWQKAHASVKCMLGGDGYADILIGWSTADDYVRVRFTFGGGSKVTIDRIMEGEVAKTIEDTISIPTTSDQLISACYTPTGCGQMVTAHVNGAPVVTMILTQEESLNGSLVGLGAGEEPAVFGDFQVDKLETGCQTCEPTFVCTVCSEHPAPVGFWIHVEGVAHPDSECDSYVDQLNGDFYVGYTGVNFGGQYCIYLDNVKQLTPGPGCSEGILSTWYIILQDYRQEFCDEPTSYGGQVMLGTHGAGGVFAIARDIDIGGNFPCAWTNEPAAFSCATAGNLDYSGATVAVTAVFPGDVICHTTTTTDPPTTTTTDPGVWWCGRLDTHDGDCVNFNTCFRKTEDFVMGCLTAGTCTICDGPFETADLCDSSGCVQTTTTTEPPFWTCCSQIGGDCTGPVTCVMGGCPSGSEECGGPYGNEVCDSTCVSQTTTSTCGDPDNECDRFSCILWCEGGVYQGIVPAFDVIDCKCVEPQEFTDLIGEPCSGHAGGGPMCNRCPESEYACSTTTTEP